MISSGVNEHEADRTRGALRSLYDWFTGASSPDPASDPHAGTSESTPARIGHYTVTAKLGQGGMGVVYAARDERLGRAVALKTIASLSGDDTARRRFWREARAAASVSHPNICQIYEIGEDGGQLFIAMELLEGVALSDHLRRHGPLGVQEAVQIGLGILAALSALHARGIVHRDLKPSNVYLTAHGARLLDFGLARPAPGELDTMSGVTRAGAIVGTPGYMAPEQTTDEGVDARTDLFAAGAILFEMLAGRPAFAGRSAVDVLHATRYEHPPALTGSPAVAALDRVIRRALAKRPSERPASADAMAEQLRRAAGTASDETPALASVLTRLVVLPFRVLRPDPETDFLAFSLPDAIATSLSAVPSLVLRSHAVAGRFAGEAPDLRALAAEADVDRVVLGTLLRSADQLRVTVQLVEAPGGTLLTSHAVQSSMGDLFGLQDDLARRIVGALAPSLVGGAPSPVPDAPHDARAYELYLRANELARTYAGLAGARDLYEQALELDTRFAPAWARVGRCVRVIGKFIDGSTDTEARAEDAFRRALALNPRLTIAHKFYANLEADMGQASRAMVRLLGEATRHGNDPELFAGLVHACRYCGLFEQSIAAHAEARRLDPHIPTGYEQTLLLAGDIDRLLAADPVEPGSADAAIRVVALGLAGRIDDARARLAAMQQFARIPAFRIWADHLGAWLDRRRQTMLEVPWVLGSLKIQDDPEAIFQEGWMLCDVGEHEAGLGYLQRAVARGYCAAATLAQSPQFDALRDTPAFRALLADAESGREAALAAFRAAGGERLVGM